MPFNGSGTRHPPSLHGVPRRGSPASSVLLRCYDALSPSRRASFPSLGGTAVSPADLFPQVADALSLWAWTFGLPEPTRNLTAEISGFSQVPGRTLVCACPGLLPRGTPGARPMRHRGCCLPLTPRRRLPDLGLSGLSYHGLHTRCLRFAAAGYPDTTQDSLPVGGQPLPGRTRTYQVHDEGFQVLSIACAFLPSQI